MCIRKKLAVSIQSKYKIETLGASVSVEVSGGFTHEAELSIQETTHSIPAPNINKIKIDYFAKH